ncbi:protein phosphatase 2C domain-containing protein [Amycolatopsis alkalitolerans]|uniref:Protein phosphatase 2C domain-containing protein n=1 Tax=Amycolatopsis alkalitolerans TaxID=2547244 RepID=A0A5C4M6E8_9PSEU|nr:protein phosphatase 2C domain-containing protein [Amycolatopsis alkalitolerans]TNC28511.1 hypothetical protein FG385_04345 [Amycolatopsis alkalitolerans]
MPTIKVAEQAGVGIDGAPRPSEDHVVILENAVVLLDGATAPAPGLPPGGWYAGLLAAELADALRAKPEEDLRALLSGAIAAVAAAHDLHPGASPSSTVAMLRWTTSRIDGLVLADSPVVAFGPAGADPLTDDRLARLRRSGRLNTTAEVHALRNRPGGFWVAEATPAAASRARCRSWPRGSLDAVLLASDGVSVGVDDYGLFDWPQVLTAARERGLSSVLEAVRAAERTDPRGKRWPRAKVHDDQALVLVEFDGAELGQSAE